MSADSARVVGLTGARFGRVARDADPVVPPQEPPPGSTDQLGSAVVSTPIGARFARASRRRKARIDPFATRAKRPPRALEAIYQQTVAGLDPASGRTTRPPAPQSSAEHLDTEAANAPTIRARPYVHTGGRTRSHTPLPIEALVCAAPGASSLRLNGSHRTVFELCRVPQSVAEVSARLGTPLAVARVLVEDLAAQQVVTVQRGVDRNSPDPILLERVLAGLRRL